MYIQVRSTNVKNDLLGKHKMIVNCIYLNIKTFDASIMIFMRYDRTMMRD